MDARIPAEATTPTSFGQAPLLQQRPAAVVPRPVNGWTRWQQPSTADYAIIGVNGILWISALAIGLFALITYATVKGNPDLAFPTEAFQKMGRGIGYGLVAIVGLSVLRGIWSGSETASSSGWKEGVKDFTMTTVTHSLAPLAYAVAACGQACFH